MPPALCRRHIPYKKAVKREEKSHKAAFLSAETKKCKNSFKNCTKNARNLLTFFNLRATIYFAFAEASAYLGVAQLVARNLGVVEAARPSRVTQTKKAIGHSPDGFFSSSRHTLNTRKTTPRGWLGSELKTVDNCF